MDNHQPSVQDKITTLLQLVGYEGDIPLFIQKLSQSCAMNALINLFEALPHEKQTPMQEDINRLAEIKIAPPANLRLVLEKIAQAGGIDPANLNEKLQKIVETYFGLPQFQQTYSKILLDALYDLVDTVSDSFSEEKQKQIEDHLQTFQQRTV